ncbi:hypothetical protein [Acidovorax sp. BLS4]|uniref:hypothetical protein n=1 Tax=Acidovorax sp. BLS4 TaxID=3273430 RepID=UPI00355BF156
MQKTKYQIAVIPGDGIGKEVMPEGLRAIQTAAERFGLNAAKLLSLVSFLTQDSDFTTKPRSPQKACVQRKGQ